MEQEIEEISVETQQTTDIENTPTPQDIVKEVFESFFGEERVDIQVSEGDLFKVLIHYPELEITDSNDCKMKVYDLFAKYVFDSNGKLYGGLQIKKTTFTQAQLSHGYIHSHTPRLGNVDWKDPCYGNGPIRSTISVCSAEFDKDLLLKLCWETDIYLHTESTAAGPYIRLQTVNQGVGTEFYGASYNVDIVSEKIVESIVKYIIRNRLLKFATYNGLVVIGENPYKIPLVVGDILKNAIRDTDVINADEIYSNLMFFVKYTIDNGKLYIADNVVTSYNLQPVTFKGQEYALRVTNDNEFIDMYCASPSLTRAVISRLLKHVNYKIYERELGTTEEDVKFQIED